MQSSQKNRHAHNFMDLTGRTFGRLTVVGLSLNVDGSGKPCWKCRCACGNKHTASGSCLRRGQTQSCGCLMIERTKEANTRHGRKGSRVYRIWGGMWTRCRNPKSRDFPNYGGRGITVCERWESFSAFLEDMGDPPEGDFTIERRENDLGYSPENCYWTPREKQAINRRSSIFVEHDGRRLVASQWDREFGFREGTIARRVKRGWPKERLFVAPRTSINRSQETNGQGGTQNAAL
jgi:hypothetical protein